MVGVDGSPHSFGGLRTACALAKGCGKHVDIVSASGAREGSLDLAMAYAERQGVSASATRLGGLPAKAILDHAARVGAWLLVVGRIGADSDESMDIGSVTERLVRHAPCDVFLSSRTASIAAVDQQASVS